MKLAYFVLITALLTACTFASKSGSSEKSESETREFINAGYHEIAIADFTYSPNTLTVYQGDRVKWINNMPMVKSVWLWGIEPSPIIRPGKSWSYIFTETGFYKYRDKFIQDMTGNITVLPYEERPDIKAKLEQEQIDKNQ